jgi:hypothetical protein
VGATATAADRKLDLPCVSLGGGTITIVCVSRDRVMIEWAASPVNDMTADAAVALILSIEANPHNLKVLHAACSHGAHGHGHAESGACQHHHHHHHHQPSTATPTAASASAATSVSVKQEPRDDGDDAVADGAASAGSDAYERQAKKLKVQELRDALAAQGLDTAGAKDALVERLVTAHASAAAAANAKMSTTGGATSSSASGNSMASPRIPPILVSNMTSPTSSSSSSSHYPSSESYDAPAATAAAIAESRWQCAIELMRALLGDACVRVDARRRLMHCALSDEVAPPAFFPAADAAPASSSSSSASTSSGAAATAPPKSASSLEVAALVDYHLVRFLSAFLSSTRIHFSFSHSHLQFISNLDTEINLRPCQVVHCDDTEFRQRLQQHIDRYLIALFPIPLDILHPAATAVAAIAPDATNHARVAPPHANSSMTIEVMEET